VFSQHTSVTNATDVQGFCFFTHGRDPHELLKDAKLMSTSSCLAETHQRASLYLLQYKS